MMYLWVIGMYINWNYLGKAKDQGGEGDGGFKGKNLMMFPTMRKLSEWGSMVLFWFNFIWQVTKFKYHYIGNFAINLFISFLGLWVQGRKSQWRQKKSKLKFRGGLSKWAKVKGMEIMLRLKIVELPLRNLRKITKSKGYLNLIKNKKKKPEISPEDTKKNLKALINSGIRRWMTMLPTDKDPKGKWFTDTKTKWEIPSKP